MTVQSNLGLYPTGVFFPFNCTISAVVTGQTTLVTTNVDHMFVPGNSVKFVIPKVWGIQQLNGLLGYIISVPADDQILVNIDSTFFDPFISYTPPNSTVVVDNPQVLPVGDANTGALTAVFGSAKGDDLNFGGIPPYSNTVPGAFNVTFFPED